MRLLQKAFHIKRLSVAVLLSFLVFPLFGEKVENDWRACTNNTICEAVDLGVSVLNTTIGDATLGSFDNNCGDNLDEPNPADLGNFNNEAGVWFKFSTDNNPGSVIVIQGISDPLNTGDAIDLQMAVYKRSIGACPQIVILSFIEGKGDFNGLDGELFLRCPQPNSDYYILVDGANVGNLLRGNFGLQVYHPIVTEAGDLICDAQDLGVVPENGQIQTPTSFTNFCAGGVGDPDASAFRTQVGVWFEFIAPQSGHVIVEGIADTTLKPLGVQLAVWTTDDFTCSGQLVEVASGFSAAELDEILDAPCLYPGKKHWVLVDGFGAGGIGAFKLNIIDAGDITPRVNQQISLCAGDSLLVGNSIYKTSGNYIDTISLNLGCDSIVFTDLTILDSLQVDVEVVQSAIGLGVPNGQARALVTGGSGNYTIEWCSGTIGDLATDLLGNQECCVIVTDDIGCTANLCFDMPLVTELIPNDISSNLDCFGSQNGQATFSISNGVPPYTYQWAYTDGGPNESGFINTNNEVVTLDQLRAGTITVNVNDAFGDTTFSIDIIEPAQVQTEISDISEISCFGACDGAVLFQTSGGTGLINTSILDGDENVLDPNQLCRGQYLVISEDENGCLDTIDLIVNEPPPFVAEIVVDQDVSCYEGADGRLRLANETEISTIAWNTGDSSPVLDNLSAGTYEVSVTNLNGCEAIQRATITAPLTPLEVGITVENPVQCAGDANGILLASVVGDGTNFSFQWNGGNASPEPLFLGARAGSYEVVVENEKGCLASDMILLEEPTPVSASFSLNPLTCINRPEDGALLVTSTTGGTPEYTFSLNGSPFQRNTSFLGLEEGMYNLVVKDSRGCEAVFDTILGPPPSVSVDLGSDISILLGDSVLLAPDVNGENLLYTWRSAEKQLLQTAEYGFMVNPISNTPFTVHILDTISQCEAEDQIIVKIDRQRSVFAPSAFSPNDDGRNDTFYLQARSDVEEIEVFQVYDRTGALLFEAKNYFPAMTNGAWDGRINGDVLPNGVYVYYAIVRYIDGQSEVFKGDVLLIK